MITVYTISLLFLLSQRASAQNNITFEVEYQWTHINYTWRTPMEYQAAIQNGTYIPENNFIVGIKLYKNTIYFTLPRVRPGAPVTMATISQDSRVSKINRLLVPFPSWEYQRVGDCSHLLNVQSMEIDRNGTMWVIDGTRTNAKVSGNCPSKLVLFDLEDGNRVIRSYDFPEALSRSNGGWLNDIVIDDTNGDHAYISDNSGEPGLVVYSRRLNRAWKLFTTAGFQPNGIALSPRGLTSGSRTLFYSSLQHQSLLSITTELLRNETFALDKGWERNVRMVGVRQSNSGGMVVDNRGQLYYGLIELNGVARWNINTSFNTSRVIFINKRTIIWPDSFGMDDKGYLYLLSNHANEYFQTDRKMNVTSESRFRVLNIYTGTKSYLYSNNE